ncbi:MAG: purine-nucleoside phosphorylase [bacterium]
MYNKILVTTDCIKDSLPSSINLPKIGIILGSGLSNLVNIVEHKFEIDYKDIPNFPLTTVEGHDGKLVFGKINGVDVLLMKGRFHYYEGYSMRQITFPIHIMKHLGVEKLIVSNASGGVNKSFQAGDLMIINDFINFMGDNPLIGINDDRLGERFPDMTEPYSLELIKKAKEVGDKLGITYKEGVYMAFTGPNYETSAEIKFVSTIGGDAVGMSTVPETLVANYLNMEVLGISCVTNMATGIQTVKHSHENVMKIAEKSSETFCKWVCELLKEI